MRRKKSTAKDNIIPFPLHRRKRYAELDEELGLVWSDGRKQTECDEMVHVFDTVPGRCRCGKNFWEGVIEPPEDAG